MTIEKNHKMAIDNIDVLNSNTNTFFRNARNEALENLNNLRIPSKTDEKYKYTNLQNILKHSYNQLYTPETVHVNLDEVFRCDVPELETSNIITINGWYSSQPKINVQNNGVVWGSMNEAALKYPDLFERFFS
jgi:Fe-S cluster assembly protein SufD